MDEMERGLAKFDKQYEKELVQLDGRIDKDLANYIVGRLMDEIEKKYGMIVEKPIFVERKIEVLIPHYTHLTLNKVGLIRWLASKLY